jgi:hypothetical protein
MLDNAIKQTALCPKGLALKELDIARNVMVNKFIGEVQPWLLRVTQGYRASYENGAHWLSQFEQLPVELTRPMADYFAQAEQLNYAYLEAIRQHTAYWQQLFDDCNQSAVPVR